MNICKYGAMLAGICISLTISTTSQAGPLCDWLGIGCDPIHTTGRSDDDAPAPTVIDQNNPPEVFAFTVSGAFDEWSDIPPEPFVCDTREREDRSCIWYGHLAEIKRNAAVKFTPYPHDRGMYKVDAWVESKLAQDPNFRVYVGIDDAPDIQEAPGVLVPVRRGISITHLAQYTLKGQIFEAGRYTVNKRETPFGAITLKFKEVLK